MMGVVLRRAKDEDLNALYMIDKACFPRHHFSKYFIQLLLECPSSVAIVAMFSSRIVGFIIGVIEDENEGRIYTIGVLPDFRRRGIGRLLLEKLEEELARRGAVKCRLEVMEGNIAALQLYSKMGYHKVGVIRRYYGDKDGIVMEKVLKPLRTA